MLAAVLPLPHNARLYAGVCVVLTLVTAAADDDVVTAPNADVDAVAGDEQQAVEQVFGKAGAVARHLRLDWAERRLTIAGEREPTLRPFVRKQEARIAAAVAKQAIEAAVKEGLSRNRAEALFGALAGGDEAPQAGLPQRQGVQFFQPAFANDADDADDADDAQASALQRAFAAAKAAAFAVGGGGGSSSSGGDGATMTERFEAGATKGTIRSNQARDELALDDTTRKLAVTRDGETELTIRVETAGGDGDSPDELLQIRQTETAFRAVLVRDGATVGAAEGETFAAAYAAAPAFVREQLLPALAAGGIVAPPLPDDAAVKAAVLAEIRAAAGRPVTAVEEKPEPDAKDASPVERAATAEWRQALRAYREKRLASLIETFRLTADAAYLRGLLAGATPEDATLVRARLEKLAGAK